jgi:hypothetical protein
MRSWLPEEAGQEAPSISSPGRRASSRAPTEAANVFSARAGVAAANAAAFAELQGERALLTRRLEDALHSRAVIDQAVGILIERERLGPEEAFQMLRSASQKLNVKLRVIAAEILESATGRPAPEAAIPPDRAPERTSGQGSA